MITAWEKMMTAILKEMALSYLPQMFSELSIVEQ